MEKKTFRAPVELKADGDEGTFRSVFARFNVVDYDGDLTEPGAFREGAEVIVEGWNHDYGLPVGKGVIHANDEEAWLDGRFFLETTGGREHHAVLKGLGGIEEWSYTFSIDHAESGEIDGEHVRVLKGLDVWGVAPVTRGAGIGTRTLALKGIGDLTDDEIAHLKARMEALHGSNDEGRNSEDGEGEVDEGGTPDDKPSGVSPSVVLAQLTIAEMEG